MQNLKNFLSRNSVWLIMGLISLIIIYPSLPEFKTLLMIVLFESIALGLSGISLFVFTRIDFINEFYKGEKNVSSRIISFVFLSVHILVGLIVLGVYIAQFSS